MKDLLHTLATSSTHKIDGKIELTMLNAFCDGVWCFYMHRNGTLVDDWNCKNGKQMFINYTTRAGVNSEVMFAILRCSFTPGGWILPACIHTTLVRFTSQYITDLWVHSFSLTVHVPQAEIHLDGRNLCTLNRERKTFCFAVLGK